MFTTSCWIFTIIHPPFLNPQDFRKLRNNRLYLIQFKRFRSTSISSCVLFNRGWNLRTRARYVSLFFFHHLVWKWHEKQSILKPQGWRKIPKFEGTYLINIDFLFLFLHSFLHWHNKLKPPPQKKPVPTALILKRPLRTTLFGRLSF